VDGGDARVKFAIDPAKLREAFAADVPSEQPALMTAIRGSVAEPKRLFGKLGFTPDAVGTIARDRVAAMRHDESEGTG
jgi:hypothetical protein